MKIYLIQAHGGQWDDAWTLPVKIVKTEERAKVLSKITMGRSGGYLMIELSTLNYTKTFNNYKELSSYLSQTLCDTCWKGIVDMLPLDMLQNMSYTAWVDTMMSTQCGAEWIVKELED